MNRSYARKFSEVVPGLDKTARGLGTELALGFVLLSLEVFWLLLFVAPANI